jgi:molybdenum cofactor sulfurtransferase
MGRRSIAESKETIDDMGYRRFIEAYPAFASTQSLDRLRAAEYGRLDDLGQVYLDYTGAGLYAASQVEEHTDLLMHHVFGNPHSVNPTSLATTELVNKTRRAVLDFFNASPQDYDLAFTANASGALKLVGESYPFRPGQTFLLTVDNHNSVNGIREFARAKGAKVQYIPVTPPDLRIDESTLETALADSDAASPGLIAYPAQSNFSGVQHDLAWINRAQDCGWHVLLDAAAFVPTNRLDLSRFSPDFVALSFYKMFGYPTGIGVLLIRRSALGLLRRPWFAGGTISIISVQGEGWHQPLPHAAKLEDGTVDYLSIPAVEIGLRHLELVGIDSIQSRVKCLTGWLIDSLIELRHANGAPLVRLFGPSTTEDRGGTIAFNLLDPSGVPFHFRHVEGLAAEQQISLRTGGFCNPGANETAHGLTADEMKPFFTETDLCSFDDFYERSQQYGKHPSTIRVSTGIASNYADVERFLDFSRTFLDRSTDDIARIAPRWTHSEVEVETP